jgi:hypothetical protein
MAGRSQSNDLERIWKEVVVAEPEILIRQVWGDRQFSITGLTIAGGRVEI